MIGQIVDNIGPVAQIEDIAVLSVSASQKIIARPAYERIVATVPIDGVVARQAFEAVVELRSINLIVVGRSELHEAAAQRNQLVDRQFLAIVEAQLLYGERVHRADG